MKTIRDLDVKERKVFLRVDFNVPLDKKGEVADGSRIIAALPTIRYLLDQKAKVIIGSHLGRPKGRFDSKYSLGVVARELARLLKQPVCFASDCVGEKVDLNISQMQGGSVMLLENLRFHEGEEKNSVEFSEALAKPYEVYINDAFGVIHRAHASTVGMPSLIKERGIGFLIEKELQFLGDTMESPERPFVVILGGAKVSDKIKVIEKLLEKADILIIGGAMAYTFLKSKGIEVGASLVQEEYISMAKSILESAKKKGIRVLLPVDHYSTSVEIGSEEFQKLKHNQLTYSEISINEGLRGVDIGKKTVEVFSEAVSEGKVIFWNGPMGVFEQKSCAVGTFEVAKAIAESEAVSIIGGGDSASAIEKSGYGEKVTFISTGGGASLEFLEGKEMPGLKIMR